MTSSPKISVILPCFQAEPFVEEAVRSILGQTLPDLELIAVDDGSTDRTREILESIAAGDARVRVLANERNLGLVPTLNRGVAEARGDFIARMDADDVSALDRLDRQVRLLEERPDLDVVGGGVELIALDGRLVGSRPARFVEPEAAHFLARFATPLAHVTALGRATAFRAHPYRQDPGTLHCEDYDLWTRMLRGGVRLGNIPDTMAQVRVHGTSVSRAFEAIQIENFVSLSQEHLRALGAPPLSEGAHRVLVNRIDPGIDASHLQEGLAALRSIEDAAQRDAPNAHACVEIKRLAAEQRLDILVQATLHASPGARLSAAVRGALSAPWFAFGPAAPYLRRKLRSGREAGLVR